MATEVRPTTRFQPPDWFTNSYAISTNAERQRSASHEVRQESRFLRNETDSQTKWDQYSNNVRLADRIDHIRKVSRKINVKTNVLTNKVFLSILLSDWEKQLVSNRYL